MDSVAVEGQMKVQWPLVRIQSLFLMAGEGDTFYRHDTPNVFHSTGTEQVLQM